ncbi:MAG: HAD family phosphatase [Bacteroidales bacterium]
MASDRNYVVFFDLDRTLTSMNSGHAIIKAASDMGLINKKDITTAIIHTVLYKTGLRSTYQMIEGMGNWLKGTRVDLVSAIAREAVELYLVPSLFKQVRDEIRFHKGMNAHIVILSSAIEEICIPMAEQLGIDSVLCTKMETTGHTFTGKPEGAYCFGNEKAARITKHCKELGLTLSSAYCYADSVSDIPALSLVGNPVCINPDRKLKKHATRKGWRISDWSPGII